MDGLQFLGSGIGLAGLSIAAAQVMIVQIKSKANGKFVSADVCTERTNGFSREVSQLREDMREGFARIERLIKIR
jgi:hypothetical protein